MNETAINIIIAALALVAGFFIGIEYNLIDVLEEQDTGIDVQSHTLGYADGLYMGMDMMRRDLSFNPDDPIGVYTKNMNVSNAFFEDVGYEKRLSEIDTSYSNGTPMCGEK